MTPYQLSCFSNFHVTDYYAEIATVLGLFYLVYFVIYIEKHKNQLKAMNHYRWARWLVWNATGVFTVLVVVFASYFLDVLFARGAQNVFLVACNFFFFSLLVFFWVHTDELRLNLQLRQPTETKPSDFFGKPAYYVILVMIEV